MKTTIRRNPAFQKPAVLLLARALVVAGCLFWAASGLAQSPPADDGGPTNVPLASWSFQDTTNWSSDQGWLPISFTNLTFSYLGYDQTGTRTLVVDTNVPAWLQYYVYEPNNAATNLTVDTGSVTFWFAPDWGSADTNALGSGPGDWGRLFEVGSYTPDSSYGWWSIFVDEGGTNLYFAVSLRLKEPYLVKNLFKNNLAEREGFGRPYGTENRQLIDPKGSRSSPFSPSKDSLYKIVYRPETIQVDGPAD